MSVWDEACYSTDPLCTLLRFLTPADVYHPVLQAFCGDSYTRNECVGDALPEGRVVDSLQANPRVAKVLEPHAFSKWRLNSEPFLNMLGEGEVRVGIRAVYGMLGHVYDHTVRWNNEVDWGWMRKYVCRMVRCNQYASYQSSPAASDMIDALMAKSSWMEKLVHYDNMAKTFQHLHGAFNEKRHKWARRRAEFLNEPPPILPKHVINLGKGWEARRYGSLTVLTNKERLQTVHHVLTPKDIRRCSQMCSSLADMELYFANYGSTAANQTLYQGYRETIRQVFSSMKRTDRPNDLARACDVAAALLLTYYAGDVWDQAYHDQSKKVRDENLNPVLNVHKLCQHFLTFPLAESIELSKVYKFLPCPDFDFLTLFDEQRRKHHDTRPAFYDNDMGCTEADFELYQKHQLLFMHHSKHGRCFGSIQAGVEERPWHLLYPDVHPSNIPYREVGDIVWTTHFRYNKVSGSYNPYIKDKTLAPNFISRVDTEADMHELPEAQRSYTLHYLESVNLATPERVATGAPEERYEVGHTVFPKPETKKAKPRNVYVNNYPGRVLVSELDNNIAEYLEHKPGTFSGLSRTEAFNKFKEMGGDIDEHQLYEYVSVSFDLAGWSPRQSPKLRQVQLRKWATAFNVPYITEVDKQFTGAPVHYIHKGIHQKYTLAGNDLEGYLGRLNTDLHIDIMGYAIRKLRDRGDIETGAKLAVQIDDGLCVLRFPRGTPNQDIVAAVRFIEKVYAWFSLEISWDKTYVSRRLRMFLNEIEYDDIRVTPGVKAFLRIRADRADGIRCFLRETNRAAGQVSGAIEAGTAPMTAWVKYAMEIGKSYLDWARHTKTRYTPDELAVVSFVPVAFGGYGCMSMLQFASNCTDNSTAAGISILKAIATYEPLSVPVFNAFISQEIAAKSGLAILRDPASFHIVAPHLTDNLELPHAKRALSFRVRNPLVREAIEFEAGFDADALIAALPPIGDTRGKALELAYSSTPLAVLDHILNQFTRASSITALIGFRLAVRVYRGYRRQFHQVNDNCLLLLRHGSAATA